MPKFSPPKNCQYLLICGPGRTGKSIIRKQLLEKYHINGLCTDSLVSMLMHAEPDSGINFQTQDYSPITKYIYGLLTYQNNYPMVLEGVGVFASDWPKYAELKNVWLIGVGASSISVEEKMQNIRQNPSYNEWTHTMNDLELKELCQKLITDSQKIKIECENFGLPFFDLSGDFEAKTTEVVDYVAGVLG